MIKSLHVPFHFYPDAVGGTEVYTLALVERLRRMGHETEVAAPGSRRESYIFQGINVHRFVPGRVTELSMLYGGADEAAAEQFEEILDRFAPALVHFHCLSPAISFSLLSRVKRRGIRVVLTMHIPGILCARGTFVEHGTEVCNGVMEVRRCTRCLLAARGLPQPLAALAASLPVQVGAAVSSHSRWATLIRMTQMQDLRQATLRRFLAEVDHIVALSDWMRKSVLSNGIPAEKVSLCRHGTTQAAFQRKQPELGGSKPVKRIAYLGRIDKNKGVDVLLEAVLRVPDLPLRLDVYGIIQSDLKARYFQDLQEKAQRDPRIRFLAPLLNDQVPQQLQDYDLVAIPSVWLETGPLTVYDAFAAGVPVVGSNRGGIAELVTHEQDGLLVAPGDVAAWSQALTRVCTEDGLLERLSRGIAKPRAMDTVALEMAALYESLLVEESPAASVKLSETL